MNNIEKIINKLCSDESIETPDIVRLEILLDEELSRDNPDFDLIDEITKTILEMKNLPKQEIDIDSEIRTIKRRGIKHSLKFRLPRVVSVAVAVTTIVVVNLFASPFIADSVKNFFPAIYTQEDKTILDFSNSEKNNNPTIQAEIPNYCNIKELTRINGMNVYAPTEDIPTKGYTMNINYDNSGGVSDILFLMYCSDSVNDTISVEYKIIDNDSLNDKVVELSENSVLDSGFIIDGMDAYVFFDRKAAEWPNNTEFYTMYFYQKISDEKGILTTACTIGLDRDKAYKIFKSFK